MASLPTQATTRGNPPINAPSAPPISPFLALLPAKYWRLRKEFFTYTPPGGPINVAASAQSFSLPNVPINTDSDFLLMAITGVTFGTDDSTIVANPPLDIKFQDGSSSQFISNDFLIWDAIVGTAKEPFYLPYPRVLGGGSSFSTVITNLTATARHVSLAFHGFKIYPPTGQTIASVAEQG